MNAPDLKLARYLARPEVASARLLCASEIESYQLAEVLALADDETRALWDGLTLGYTEARGHPLLRAEIAGLYQHLCPDDVLVCTGADEAIYLLMHVLLGPGDHAIVAWPAYQSLYEVARATGASVTLLPLDPANGWALDVELMKSLLRPTTRAIVVNLPHNPTGALPDRATFDALAQVAQEAGAYLFSDEVYRWLEFDGADRLPAAADALMRGVSAGVMSKAFGLAGVRIGWLATRDADLLRRVNALKDFTTLCSSAPSEILALMALRARTRVLQRSHDILGRNLRLLDDFFKRWQGVFEWARPRAGCVGFPRVLTGGSDSRTAARFAYHLAQQQGVAVLPGSVFEYPGAHFRIGFGRADFPEALARLECYADHLQG